MDIGVGLPAAIPGVSGDIIVRWARRAEELGFSSLGIIDRLVYPNYEPLITLAAAATVTSRIRLGTYVLLGPLRANPALFAKQVATLDNLAPGRLTLGLGVGWRQDDFEASGVDYHRRGKLLDQQLEVMQRVWQGESFGFEGAIGPAPVSEDGLELLFGGSAEATVRRAVAYKAGWVGVGAPAMFEQMRAAIEAARAEAGLSGAVRYVDFAYFALGPEGTETARNYVRSFYDIAGPMSERFAERAVGTPEMVRETIARNEALGADELIFTPCSADLQQLDELAEVALA